MRILFFTGTFPPDYTGGAEVSLYHTAQGLRQWGVDCHVLTINHRQSEKIDDAYELDGLPVHRIRYDTRLPLNDIYDQRVYRAVRAELRRLQPDLVHIHHVSGASLSPFTACTKEGIPIIATLHDLWLLCPNNMRYRSDGSFCSPSAYPHGCGDCFRRYQYWGAVPRRGRLFAALVDATARFVSPSQALIDRHVEMGYARERFSLIPYGFEEAVTAEPEHPAIVKIAESAPRYNTVVFAGGGVEIKGTQVVLDAIPLLIQNVDHLRIIVAGGGEDRFLAQYRDFAPTVQVIGGVPFQDMRALFASADISLVPSVCHENSPVVIYENFQVGTPMVGSIIGGTPELIDEGETGYLFPNADAVAMAEKIILHFAKSKRERRRMRHNCINVARTRLTLDRHLAALEDVYSEVLAKHGSVDKRATQKAAA